jgi:hypothetical protein
MFGFRKSPANNKPTKQSSVNPPASFTSNPFDSDDESNAKQTLHHGKRTSSYQIYDPFIFVNFNVLQNSGSLFLSLIYLC